MFVCLFLLSYTLLLTWVIATWISLSINTYMMLVSSIKVYMLRGFKTTQPKLVIFKIIKPTLQLNLVMQVCLENFQETTTPQRVKTYLLMDSIISKSRIKLPSLYTSSKLGYYSSNHDHGASQLLKYL